MSKSFNFNEMAAFEFSALTQKNPDSISKVTVLDCKHCNDPAPREDFAVFAKELLFKATERDKGRGNLYFPLPLF